MTLFDLLFDSKIVDTETSLEGYQFYSVTPDGKFIYIKKSDYMARTDVQYNEIDFFKIEDEEEYKYYLDEIVYVDYKQLNPLISVTLEGIVGRRRSCQRNQFVAIRGTCDHNCSEDCPSRLFGYALHKLPCCDKKFVGSTVWTAKWATDVDIIKDILDWLKYCKGLDVLIVNFDFTPDPFSEIESNRDLDFEYVCFCALVQGSHIKFISDVKDIERLYREYSSKYWCADYKIEESVAFRLDGVKGAFHLERPRGEKP